MSTPQPTLAVDDEVSDLLSRFAGTLDEIKETLNRIARAVETLAAAGSG